MKVTILKKSIKEGFSERTGRDYKIQSLFVKFEDAKIYERIIASIIKNGGTDESARKAVKESEYNGTTNYTFSLNCSNYTFDKVEKFGVLDAKIIFPVNDSGYINPFIYKERNDKGLMIEQVLSYEEPKPYEPEDEKVDGWATKTKAPAPASESESELEAESTKTDVIPPMPILAEGDIDNQLPF